MCVLLMHVSANRASVGDAFGGVDPRTPVLIGQGQALDRMREVSHTKHPVELMAEAVRGAAHDAAISLPRRIDALRVVRLLSWRYTNPAHSLAALCGIEAHEYATTPHGGNMPQTLVSLTAQQIADGQLDFVVLAGGECARSRSTVSNESQLGWPAPSDSPPPTHIVDDLALLNEEELRLGITLPIHVYPMFESALRAASHRDIESHDRHIAELWSRFSHAAADNEFAWSRTAMTADEILHVSPQNRMIGLPYRKVMNSNNQVNMAAALIMCSAERAVSLGVPRDRWVFPLAGTDCHEHQFVSNRWSFAETPAVARGGALALHLAGLSIDDIALIDLYSCFPSAVQLGAAALGLDITRPLTLTGGLSFAGGPWNNYVMHSIATAMRRLRESPDEHALIWANGGYATKHAFGIYAMKPPREGFRHASPQTEIDALPKRTLAVGDDAVGDAIVDAYTVMHGRGGDPEHLIASAVMNDERRAWIVSDDRDIAASFASGEQVGRRVRLRRSGELDA